MPDVLVVTQKVVSKAEGRLVELDSVEPSPMARDWAARWDKDPRQVELVLRESAEIVRMGPGGLIISRTRHGFVCANAGVDVSNVGGGEVASLLPLDPDASARRIRDGLRHAARGELAGHRYQRLVRPAVAQRDRQRGDRVGRDRGAARPARLSRMRPDARCRRRSSPSPTSLPRPRTWPAARSSSDRWWWCGATTWRPSEAGASVLVMERERDLFP